MIDALGDFWGSIVGAFAQALAWLHDLMAAAVGPELAWGFAIIGLTVIIRLLLVPLAVKQIRSMRAMQDLQPKIKEIQEKYDTDRSLLKKDPERYKDQRQKMNEEMMSLYREEGVNPASGCLPLLAQAPIFIALFDVLQSPDIEVISGLSDATFFFLPTLDTSTSAAGWAGWLMIGLMVVTMFLAQRQMMASRGGDGSQAMQQKIMMFGMPVFLAFVARALPIGVLLYWVTTNIFQAGQQTLILAEVGDEDADEGDAGASDGGSDRPKKAGTDNKSEKSEKSGSGRADDKNSDTQGKPDRKRGTDDGRDDGRPPGGGGRPSAGDTSENGERSSDGGRSRQGHIPGRR